MNSVIIYIIESSNTYNSFLIYSNLLRLDKNNYYSIF